jgi:hypothetical protein
MTGGAIVVGRLSLEEARRGFPIVVQGPIEFALLFGVFLLLFFPVFLAIRRRSVRVRREHSRPR